MDSVQTKKENRDEKNLLSGRRERHQSRRKEAREREKKRRKREVNLSRFQDLWRG